MSRVLIPLAQGFEEIEAVTVIDLLRRAEIQVVTASLDTHQQVVGSHGIPLITDTSIEEVLDDQFDMLVLPGGQPGTDNLNADPRIHAIIKRLHQSGKLLAAICAAPLVLATAGVLNGKQATSYTGVFTAKDWPDIRLSDEAVVVDGDIITSRGPGTAMDFSLQLIEQLLGPDVRQQVEAGLLKP